MRDGQSAEPPVTSGRLSFFSRRRLLKLGLGIGALALGGAGSLLTLRGCAPDVDGLRCLTDQEHRTLAALARTLFPAGGPIPVSADDLDLAGSFDGFLADEPQETIDGLKLALSLLEFGPLVFERRLATFSNLDAASRAEHWQEVWVCSEDLTRRMVSVAFRKFLTLVYYDNPKVWPSIGYPGPSLG